eukprot:19067-Heterococcus_DN1.PRE.4
MCRCYTCDCTPNIFTPLALLCTNTIASCCGSARWRYCIAAGALTATLNCCANTRSCRTSAAAIEQLPNAAAYQSLGALSALYHEIKHVVCLRLHHASNHCHLFNRYTSSSTTNTIAYYLCTAHTIHKQTVPLHVLDEEHGTSHRRDSSRRSRSRSPRRARSRDDHHRERDDH